MTELDILSRFVSEGMTPTAAEAMWGNIYSESGGESNRVQGDFSPTRIVSNYESCHAGGEPQALS